SEVGHLNLGAGRVVWQDITRIDRSIESGEFFELPCFKALIAGLGPNKKIHLMGLVSDGGVHSVDRHYFALIEMLKRQGVAGSQVCFHVITDGRDTAPKSGLGFVADLDERLRSEGSGRIASVSGRYYAMDRNTNWERTQLYWDCITLGKGEIAPDAVQAVKMSYAAGVNDEFILPTFIAGSGEPMGRVEDGDAVIFFNFRADRARQICRALSEGEDFDAKCFKRGARPKVSLLTLTHYLDGLDAKVAFGQDLVRDTLGETLAKREIAQFRCAETEKYAHITYFFNGGAEAPFEGEERALVESPDVATYDLKPEMSLPEVADKLVAALNSKRYGFVLTNFANGDMVGHTGVFDAAVKAVEAIDTHLKHVVEAAHASGYEVLVTADHGNCEEMATPEGEALTNHSYKQVPFVYIAAEGSKATLVEGGKLADVAPSVLALMGEEAPVSMDGESRLVAINEA
ncbi:MAG: 2,3-bisphosphoglycerate-independent phosphoglycerate mutase, partial [Planctomycetes bacterium]|nr:2,3-bisphosphoglycerate-independent phosphoglycerate mutase [Planctomycetota bacterium]